MADMPGWRKALREPNAVAWIAFFFLVLAIGFGSAYWGGSGPGGPAAHHASR